MTITIKTDSTEVTIEPDGAFRTFVTQGFARIDLQLQRLYAQGQTLMSKATDIGAVVAALNTATNEIAADLARLRAQAAGGLTPEEADAFQAELSALETRLTAMGVDPEDPVPAP